MGGGDALLPPRQVLLQPDPAKPNFPLAALPLEVARALGDAALGDGSLGVSLQWGTEAPPPPVDALFAASLVHGTRTHTRTRTCAKLLTAFLVYNCAHKAVADF